LIYRLWLERRIKNALLFKSSIADADYQGFTVDLLK